jgi:type I restriction enzyme S subunit
VLREQLNAAARMRAAADVELSIGRQILIERLAGVFSEGGGPMARRVKLGDVLKRRQDVVHPHDVPHGHATFVGLEHIESYTGRRTGGLEVDMAKLTGRKPRFRKGDVVYGYLRPYLNKVWIADVDGLCSVDQYVYHVDANQVCPEYIAWFMRSPVFLARAPVDQAPGQLPRIRAQEVAEVLIDLPPFLEQRQQAESVGRAAALVERLDTAAVEQAAEIDRLPAALLRRAFSGRQ